MKLPYTQMFNRYYSENKPVCYCDSKTGHPRIYSIQIPKKGMSKADAVAILQKLERLQVRNPSLAFYLAESTLDSHKPIYARLLKTGGRPRKILMGTRIPYHLHIGVLSTDLKQSPRKDAIEVCEFIKKRRKFHAEARAVNSMYPIGYSKAQADSWHTSNNFDFDYFCDAEYNEPYNNEGFQHTFLLNNGANAEFPKA